MVTSRRDLAAHLLHPLGVPWRCDRALDQREVVRTLDRATGGLEEVGHLDLIGQRDQLALEVEQGQLATVTGGELPVRQLGPLGRHSSRTPRRLRIRPTGKTGPSCRRTGGRAGSARSGRSRTSCCAPARRGCSRRARRVLECRGDEAHHHLRAADHRCRPRALETGDGISLVTSPTRPSHLPAALSTVYLTSIPASRQAWSSPTEHLLGRAGP